jgi:hypothetical protein
VLYHLSHNPSPLCKLWSLHRCLQCILDSPSQPPPPHLEQFQQVSFFYFHIWIQNTPTKFTPFALSLCPSTSHWYPPPEKTCFFLLPFFLKCILIVQRGISLILQACVYHALIKLPLPPLLTHSLSPCSPNIHQLMVQCITLNSCLEGCPNISHSLTIFLPSPTSHHPLRQTNKFCSLYIYACKYTHDHICIFIYIIYFIFIILLHWGYIVTFTKVLTIYHSWIHSSTILLYLPPSILRIVSTGLIFPFSYMSALYSTTFTLLHPISSLLPLAPTPRQDLLYLPVLPLKPSLELNTFTCVWTAYVSQTMQEGFDSVHAYFWLQGKPALDIENMRMLIIWFFFWLSFNIGQFVGVRGLAFMFELRVSLFLTTYLSIPWHVLDGTKHEVCF